MSIIIAGNLGKSAFVVTDSWCSRTDGAPTAANKLFTLPYQGTVIAGRGACGFIANVVTQCAVSGANVEDVAAEIPAIVARVTAAAPEGLAHLPGGNGADVVIAGWSTARGGAMVYGFHQEEIGGDIETFDIEPGYALAAPWRPDMGAPPSLGDFLDAREIVSEPRLTAVARRQCRKMDQLFPPKASGGNLVLALVDRQHLTTTKLGDLDALEPAICERGATVTVNGVKHDGPSSQPIS